MSATWLCLSIYVHFTFCHYILDCFWGSFAQFGSWVLSSLVDRYFDGSGAWYPLLCCYGKCINATFLFRFFQSLTKFLIICYLPQLPQLSIDSASHEKSCFAQKFPCIVKSLWVFTSAASISSFVHLMLKRVLEYLQTSATHIIWFIDFTTAFDLVERSGRWWDVTIQRRSFDS